MIKDSKHSGRRAFLCGVGGGMLALPLLEYTHGNAWAGGSASPKRFVTVFSHGGTISNHEKTWWHDGTEAHHGQDLWRPADPLSESLVLGPIHESLESFKDKLLLIEGIDNKTAIEQDQYNAGAHYLANATALTAADTTNDANDHPSSQGPSIDHVIAERLAAHQPTPFQRVHLYVNGHDYGTPYYRAPGESAGGIASPAEAFATLFAGVSSDPEPSPAALRQIKMRTSALDGLLESYAALKSEVSASDRHQIDAHLEHLRALEHELQNPVVCSAPQGIDEGDGAADVIGPLHVQLIIAALRCGLTNVANLEIADILTPWTPTGVPTAQPRGHSLGHLARDIGPQGPDSALYDDWFAEILDNRRWRMGLVAQLLEGLDDPDFLEGNGTILDNSVMLFTSEFRNGSRHSSWNMPVLLAGSAGGYFDTGRFVDYNVHGVAPGTSEYRSPHSTHNLFTSLLQAMGEPDTHFGNDHAEHQGPLPDLT